MASASNETGVARQVDLDGAAQPDLIEENRLLRQPGERAAGAKVELDGDLRVRPERAIDFFRGGSGYGQPRTGAEVDIDVKAVAARHAAGGVDDDGVKRGLICGVGKADPQRAGLVHPLTPAAAGRGRYCERNAPDRAIAGEDLAACRVCRRVRKQVSSPAAPTWFNNQIDIARSSAPSSRLARSQA